MNDQKSPSAHPAPVLVAGIAIAVTTAWAATGGGYESLPTLGGGYGADPWFLGAMMIVALLGASAVGLGSVRLSRWGRLAAAAFAGYVVWSCVSIFWASDKGSAFLGSDRALVYLCAFLLFAILPWRSRSLRLALWLLVAALGALAIVAAIRLAALADPSSLFINARLSYPLGYYNADAAMFMTVALTAVGLSAQRAAPAPARVAGVVLAGVCLQLAVLSQSRGWLFTAPIALALALLLVPGRLRLLVFAIAPAAAAAAIAPTLLHVYAHATAGGVPIAQPALGYSLHVNGVRAVKAMAIADVALALLVTALVMTDRRLVLSKSAQRRTRRAMTGVAAAAAIAAVTVGLVATHGNPVARVERAWHSFANASNTANGSSRFTTLGSQRVDFWRVALDEFSRHPLQGIGQDNFAAAYLRTRRTDQEPRWVHSLELRLLTHTGVIGALLFAAFLVTAVIGALASRRWGNDTRVSAAIALLPLIVWLVHGSIDWLWEFPALSVPALAFAGAATALAGARRSTVPSVAIAPARIAGILLLLATLAALAIPFTAGRDVQDAIAVWQQRPGKAYAKLRSAANLMPFDAQVYLLGGAIALNVEDRRAARYWLSQAERHDPRAWLAPFALGLLDGEQSRPATARSQLLRARELNPHEPVIALALARLARGRPLTFAQAQVLLAERTRQRFGR